jgi:hypothetical protein
MLKRLNFWKEKVQVHATLTNFCFLVRLPYVYGTWNLVKNPSADNERGAAKFAAQKKSGACAQEANVFVLVWSAGNS